MMMHTPWPHWIFTTNRKQNGWCYSTQLLCGHSWKMLRLVCLALNSKLCHYGLVHQLRSELNKNTSTSENDKFLHTNLIEDLKFGFETLRPNKIESAFVRIWACVTNINKWIKWDLFDVKTHKRILNINKKWSPSTRYEQSIWDLQTRVAICSVSYFLVSFIQC